MEVIRVEKDWQKAGAYYVRIQGMGRQHHIPLDHEFDEHDDSDARHLLITEEDFPIATCRWFERQAGIAEIGRVVVLPEYRGRGLGALIVQEAEKWLVDEGYHTSVLESRDVALGFYEKLGYTADYSHTKQWDSFSCIHMEKQLCGQKESLNEHRASVEQSGTENNCCQGEYNLECAAASDDGFELLQEQGDNPEQEHAHIQNQEFAHNHIYSHEHNHSHGHIHSHEHTKSVLNRLSRAIGHLESVKRMVEDGKDCSEVLIQLSAVRAAINNTGKLILNDHLEHCIVDAIESGDVEQIRDFEKAINQFVK